MQRVSIQRRHLRVAFYDGRSLTVPLAWFLALQQAEPEARQAWTLNEDGDALVWPNEMFILGHELFGSKEAL